MLSVHKNTNEHCYHSVGIDNIVFLIHWVCYLLFAQMSRNRSSKNLSYKGCDYNDKTMLDQQLYIIYSNLQI